MGNKKAGFTVDDIVIKVSCPRCDHQQHSPNYPNSFGWDKADINRVGERGVIVCENDACRERFALPVKVFELMPGGRG